MPIQLTIHDGNPEWYLSPDIWVVPGTDPLAAPGSPVVGQPAYLWANVTNSGNTDADNARVDFYWANPALQVLRSTATLVGSAYANIPANGSENVLCLVPWTPVLVNGGHECLIAVANHPEDQNALPNPPPDAFDPPSYPQVAQKNLTLLLAGSDTMSMIISTHGWRRKHKRVMISAEIGGVLNERTLRSLGLSSKLKPSKKEKVKFEISLDRYFRKKVEREFTIDIPPGTSTPIYLNLMANDLDGDYVLIKLKEKHLDKVIGGIGFVIIQSVKNKKV